MAQKEDLNPGDFCQLVEQDCQMINCQLGDDQIQAMTKYDLKILIKKMAKQAAFSKLMVIKDTKTKMDNISYENSFNCQPYLHTLTRDQSSLLLALRTRTVRGIRSDYGDMFPNKQFPLPDCSEPDTLSHTLACQVMVGSDTEPSLVRYGDVFSSSVPLQRTAVDRFEELLKTRERILAS